MGSVTYKPGQNIVDDDADILVNPVNCVGAMGKGVALAFKRKWPEIIPEYHAICWTWDAPHRLTPGGCMLGTLPTGQRWAALATKDHWRDPSRIEWVDAALCVLSVQARGVGARSIAVPPPGCGNGGLDWRDIEPLVLKRLEGFDLHIYAEPSPP